MCGIIGYLDKRGGPAQPVGATLLAMLRALGCRGPDSAGVALYGPRHSGSVARLGLEGVGNEAIRDLGERIREMVPGSRCEAAGQSLRVGVEGWRDPAVLAGQLRACLPPGGELVSLGGRLELFKQVGSPDQLEADYHISRRTGTHGIGHTRLSTESKVDLGHSQPFWAQGVPDLATVHNGHITNYHKLRRRFEQKGHRFYTENDSEVIGVYLRERLSHGMTLADALRASRDDFDGSFCYLAADGTTLAYVKDGFGLKPLVVAETDAFVAVATEEIALRRALGEGFVAREPVPGSVRVWTVQQEETVGQHSR